MVMSHGPVHPCFGADPGLTGKSVVLSGEPFGGGHHTAGFSWIPRGTPGFRCKRHPNNISQGHYLLCGGRRRWG